MQTLALSTPMAGRLDVNTNVVITGYSCDNTPEIEQSRSLHETPVAGHTGHGTIGPVEPNNAKQISCFASSCVVSRVSRAHLANDVHDRVDLPFISSSSTSSTFSTLDNPSSSSNDSPIRRRIRPWRPHPHPRPRRRPRSPSPSPRLRPTLLQTTPPLSSRQTAKRDAGSCWRGQSSQRCVAFSSSGFPSVRRGRSWEWPPSLRAWRRNASHIATPYPPLATPNARAHRVHPASSSTSPVSRRVVRSSAYVRDRPTQRVSLRPRQTSSVLLRSKSYLPTESHFLSFLLPRCSVDNASGRLL